MFSDHHSGGIYLSICRATPNDGTVAQWAPRWTRNHEVQTSLVRFPPQSTDHRRLSLRKIFGSTRPGPWSTQSFIPAGSINEYQLWLWVISGTSPLSNGR